jgi:hypothetical protein
MGHSTPILVELRSQAPKEQAAQSKAAAGVKGEGTLRKQIRDLMTDPTVPDVDKYDIYDPVVAYSKIVPSKRGKPPANIPPRHWHLAAIPAIGPYYKSPYSYPHYFPYDVLPISATQPYFRDRWDIPGPSETYMKYPHAGPYVHPLKGPDTKEYPPGPVYLGTRCINCEYLPPNINLVNPWVYGPHFSFPHPYTITNLVSPGD